ncbi:hypothetical protein IGB42_03979 [Andreprevotia sp. IGB-42]|nr:hypothetical protein IGB42_03979 [Andreprevotia sp. IGB-42]
MHGRICTALSGLALALLMLVAIAAATPPAITIHYGPQILQYGRLHLPAGAGPHPLLVFAWWLLAGAHRRSRLSGTAGRCLGGAGLGGLERGIPQC